MKVKYIPDGFRTITPYLIVKNAEKLIKFLQQAFSAEQISLTLNAVNKVQNAVYRINDSMVMLAEANDDTVVTPSAFYFYTPDTDSQYQKALSVGGKSLMEPNDQFYGDRNAGIEDPCGNSWWFATKIEHISDEEMMERMMEFNKKNQ